MSKTLFKYEPDYAIAPGEILEETLQSRGIHKADLAERCGLSPKHMSLIISGKAPVTPETAINFERTLGVSASIWNNLEAKFRLHQARKQDYENLSKYDDWLRSFPVSELERRGIIRKGDPTANRVAQLLDFFGVGSVEAWTERYEHQQVAFRRSPAFESSFEAVVTWLRIGEMKAAEIDCAPYDKSKFDSALNEIRKLSCQHPDIFEPRMKELCAGSGVALVFVEELPGTHLSGATRWLKSDKAMIEISLRYKTDDHLWFTFFHEAGHIKLHGKKEVFVDEDKQSVFSGDEKEANQFATGRLIPGKAYAEFRKLKKYSRSNICKFAEAMVIAPGIIVGRLQHDKVIPWKTPLNSLKCRFELVETDTVRE